MNPEEKSVFVFDGEISEEAKEATRNLFKIEMEQGEEMQRKWLELFPRIALPIIKPNSSEKPQTS